MVTRRRQLATLCTLLLAVDVLKWLWGVFLCRLDFSIRYPSIPYAVIQIWEHPLVLFLEVLGIIGCMVVVAWDHISAEKKGESNV